MRYTNAETETQTTLRLMTAMDRQHPVTITYLKADGTQTVRTIEIYGIEVSSAGAILLKVMDRQSLDRRTFRVDRIVAYTVHRSAYTVPRPADAKPATPKGFCSSCSYLCDADELAPDHNSDLVCGDCLATFAEAGDDTAEYRHYAFH